jgi:nicotinamidase-related amidase
MRLQRDNAILLIIDVQQRLMPVIDGAEEVIRNIERLVRGFHVLGVPALLSEQYVKGLGPTVDAVRQAFEETHGYAPVEKMCFSAAEQVVAFERSQIVVAGVETHVCVFQTVQELLARNFEVAVVADAVSSRTPRNREIALRRLVSDGATLSSTEMVLFELLGVSGTDEFRAISRLIK